MYKRYQPASSGLGLKVGGGIAGTLILITAGYFIVKNAQNKPETVQRGEAVEPPTPLPTDMRSVPATGTIPFATPVPVQTAYQPIGALAFSPDGKWLAAISADRGVYLLDTGNPKPQTIVPGSGASNHPHTIVRFSPDNRLLTWFDGAEIKSYDLAARRIVATMNALPSVDYRFTRADTLLSVASLGGQIRLTWFEARTGRQTRSEVLPTDPYILSGNAVLTRDGTMLAASMSRPDPAPDAPRFQMLFDLQLRDLTRFTPGKPQETYPRWGGYADSAYTVCDVSPDLNYILSSRFEPERKRNSIFMHPTGSLHMGRVIEPYDAALGFSPDGSAIILGVAGKETVKHNWGQYRVTKWYWAEPGDSPRLGQFPELRQQKSNLPLAYEVIAVSSDQKRYAIGDPNGVVWLGGMNTGNLPKSPNPLIHNGTPPTKEDPRVVKNPDSNTPPEKEPDKPVEPKRDPPATNAMGDLQVGDWAEYRATLNGAEDWTRKLTVVGHEGAFAKVRYEIVRKGKAIPPLENRFPLNEPFKEKGHTLPKVGRDGPRTTELVSEKSVKAAFGSSALDLRLLQFRETAPVTLDGQGQQRTETTFVLCAGVPFGGLVRQRTEALIINNRPGLVTQLDLVRYGRGGKIVEGPLTLANEVASDPKVKKDEPKVVGPDDLTARRQRVTEWLKQKDYRKAAAELQAIVQRDPKDAAANRQLAFASYEISDWSEVDRSTKRLEALGPVYPVEHFRRGVALIYLPNREADALKAFEKHHAAYADDPEAWLSLAQLRLFANDPKGYREVLDHALRRQPALQQKVPRAAYLTARIASLATIAPNDFQRVAQLADQGTLVENQGAWTLHTRAMVHARAGKLADSLPWFDRSAKQDPRWPAQIVNLQAATLVALRQGRRAEALKGYQVASDLIAKGIPNLHFHDLMAMRLLQRELDSAFKKK